METDLLFKVIQGKEVTEEDISTELYYICDRVHSSCDCDCPVFQLNNNKIPDTAKDFNVNRGCDCFKNGKAMLEFIRKKL